MSRISIIAAACLCSDALAQTTAITNVSVVDVVEGRVMGERTVVLEGEQISAIVPAASFRPPDGATIVDANGMYLVPGLFDAHVHYVDRDTFGPLMIVNGVTFVRDMGGSTEEIIATRDGLNSGEILGPEMICTGAIVDGDPPVWPFSEPCDTPEEARAAVRKLHAAGVDQIKVYSKLEKEVYEAAIAEAKAIGLKAVGHIPESCTIEDAIAAGQASNEHMMAIEKLLPALATDVDPGPDHSGGTWASGRYWFLYPHVDKAALRTQLEKIAEAGMVQTPTLVVMAGIASIAGGNADEDPRMEYVPTFLRGFWSGPAYAGFAIFASRALPHMQSMVGDLHVAGCTLMAGTDLANPYVFAGFSLHDELRLLTEAGVPASEALRAATIIPAQFMGVADRLGTVETGKTASLVLLLANPLEDIRHTSKIHAVFLRGKHYDRAALDALLEGVSESVTGSRPGSGEVALDLPGEVVLRGTYTATFGNFDTGTEDVLITRTPEGYSMIVDGKPKGGGQAPSVTTWHAGPDFSFRSATWKQSTAVPIEASYHMEGEVLEAEATAGGKALPPLKGMTLAPDSLMTAPVYAGDFFALNRVNLAVGETRELQVVSFGFPTWQPSATPLTITRQPDPSLARPDGTTVTARYYTQAMTTPMGAFKFETWTDDRGIVLKSITKMPFGVITAELKPN